jgi:hypothetical protein
MRNACILVEKPEGKKPLERPRLKLEDNIRMGLRETGWKGKGKKVKMSLHLTKHHAMKL